MADTVEEALPHIDRDAAQRQIVTELPEEEDPQRFPAPAEPEDHTEYLND